MKLTELFILSLGLSMDAFAVAVCKGLCMPKVKFKSMLTVGLYFGIFQGLMPLIGYRVGSTFADKIGSVDYWLAFIILVILGIKMLKESREKGESTVCETDTDIEKMLSFKIMLPLAIATSIDALAAGVSLSMSKVSIVPAIAMIGTITLVLSMLGVWVGNKFGEKYKSKAEAFGGIILIVMGFKTLLENLGLFSSLA